MITSVEGIPKHDIFVLHSALPPSLEVQEAEKGGSTVLLEGFFPNILAFFSDRSLKFFVSAGEPKVPSTVIALYSL